ncbi:MAG: N-acetylmuramoyl-L-alanine amidase [Candidatus Coatesbacteria bacterium]|nr:N-acetylmuramoyl-L-alanine amidase [Candidatus Coatesbacteria bacterium]
MLCAWTRPKSGLAAILILMLTSGTMCLDARSSEVARVDAKIEGGTSIHIRHRIRRGDSYLLISRRWTASPSHWREIRRYNGNGRLLAGSVCKVPYDLLSPEHKYSAIVSLFPSDRYEAGEWSHRVTFSGETVFSIASWFTGSPSSASKILAYNKLDGVLLLGSCIKVPSELLLDVFKTGDSEQTSGSDLTFKTDGKGSYASYRLKSGESLYSSVVVRFTGRISYDDVMEAVNVIKSRSGIPDVTKIPAGFEIKIPFDLLLAQYLPAGDPRRREYEANMKEVSRYRNLSLARDLDGIHVILDPGHGGNDPGAIGKKGMHEDEYAYDIACRIRQILQSKTKATVYMTLRDRKTGYNVVNSKRLHPDKNESLLTTPEYRNTDARVSANLRCFLVASIYRSLPSAARKNNRVVFTSVHADSLHPALTGASIYIPDAHLSRKPLDRRGGVYDRTREARACRPIKTTYQERVRSEGYSHDFSFELLAAFGRHNVATLSYHPVKDRVTRGRREYVPAVIHHNPIPTKLLLEVGNLRNLSDCRRLMDPDYRELIATAYVDALKRYYGRESSRSAELAR